MIKRKARMLRGAVWCLVGALLIAVGLSFLGGWRGGLAGIVSALLGLMLAASGVLDILGDPGPCGPALSLDLREEDFWADAFWEDSLRSRPRLTDAASRS